MVWSVKMFSSAAHERVKSEKRESCVQLLISLLNSGMLPTSTTIGKVEEKIKFTHFAHVDNLS